MLISVGTESPYINISDTFIQRHSLLSLPELRLPSHSRFQKSDFLLIRDLKNQINSLIPGQDKTRSRLQQQLLCPHFFNFFNLKFKLLFFSLLMLNIVEILFLTYRVSDIYK